MSAIHVNKLSKSYNLEARNKSFEALNSISFEIAEGETVGIIGHNGAGKSTLLKILSGITFPTNGYGKVEGTFSSLLEVGTGFHPDLSGRDNIYFNASILGLSRREIDAHFDEVVSFSGVADFIDQPLRTYSSGMKLRLAFSILAHIRTDIIALDEVLAVGDSMFQVKCMERIFDFKNQGRTILFVSHNLSAVKKLCERTLVLQNGKLVFDGPTEDAIKMYLNNSKVESLEGGILDNIEVLTPSLRQKRSTPPFKGESLHSELSPEKCEISPPGKEGLGEVVIILSLKSLPSNEPIDLGINITTIDGNPVYHFSNRFLGKELKPENGKVKFEIKFQHQLKPGSYPIAVFIGQADQQLLWKENAATLVVPPGTPYGFHNPDAIQAPVITDFEIEKR